jgi:PAS domain-containing protein
LTIADVNPAFSRISGYIREEWISRHLSDFTIIRRDGPTVDEAIKERKTVSGRIIVQFPTGIKHMEYSYIPVCDSHGEIVKIYDIFADHTDMVEKLIESETLIAENPTSIIITNLNGNFLQFNKSFMELTSIPEERLRTMNLANFKLLSREGALFLMLSLRKTRNRDNGC